MSLCVIELRIPTIRWGRRRHASAAGGARHGVCLLTERRDTPMIHPGGQKGGNVSENADSQTCGHISTKHLSDRWPRTRPTWLKIGMT
jgi:hypothetical protein